MTRVKRDALAHAARKAERLDQFRPDTMACRVTIELSDKHRHQGRSYGVRLDVTVSGRELAVDHVHDEDVHVALREAFDDMKRQLQDSVRRAQGQVKGHAQLLHGEIVRFDAEGRAGFIRDSDGDEYWFGPDNVHDVPFEHLEIGSRVQFIPEVASQGRQAKRVSLGKHGQG